MADRNFFVTKSTAIAPAPGYPHLWLAFLDDATNGDKEFILYLQKICGYCLTGDTSEHAVFFVYGPGGNGKSVFLNTLCSVMADYAITAPVDIFVNSKSDRHPTELAMLRGARLVAVSETEEGRSWKESLLKQLSGGDTISARFMRQDNFQFKPQFKLIIVGNHKPRLNNVDEAMRRRLHILPFTHKPKSPDKHLEKKLKEEYPQILNWMLEGVKLWRAEGLDAPPAVRDATEDYFATQDIFGQWLEGNCDKIAGAEENASKLFSNWNVYAESCGTYPGTLPGFSDNLIKRGFTKRRTRNGIVYIGLKLKERSLMLGNNQSISIPESA